MEQRAQPPPSSERGGGSRRAGRLGLIVLVHKFDLLVAREFVKGDKRDREDFAERDASATESAHVPRQKVDGVVDAGSETDIKGKACLMGTTFEFERWFRFCRLSL